MDWIFVIDSVIYGVILIVIYNVISKVFARSNVGIVLLSSYIVKIVSTFFGLNIMSSLADIAVFCAFISVVISNEQKINKLLKE